jgi:hypothetical protein
VATSKLLTLMTPTGSSADNIVSHFAMYYHNEAQQLGINLDEVYSALLADGDNNPPNWYTVGREVNVYKCVIIHTPATLLKLCMLDNTDTFLTILRTHLQESKLGRPAER